MSLRSLRDGVICGGTLAIACTIALSSLPALTKTISGNVSKTNEDRTLLLYFRGVIDSDVSTAEALLGDRVEGHVSEDVKTSTDTIAPAGSKLIGHVEALGSGHNAVSSALRHSKSFQRHGFLTIMLDKIITPDKKELLISGLPVKQQSIFGSEGRFKEIDVNDDGVIVKASSLDFWGSPDFALVMPESILRMGKRLEVHIEEGDQLDFKAEIVPEEISGLSNAKTVVPEKAIARSRWQEEAGRTDSVPH